LHIPAKRINPGSRRQSGDGSDPDFQPIPEHFLDIDRPGADARRRSRSALQCLQDHRRKARPLGVAGYRAKDVRTARPEALTPPVAAWGLSGIGFLATGLLGMAEKTSAL